MKYEKPKLRLESWEEEEDVFTKSLDTDQDVDDPWTGGTGNNDNVDDSLWL